MEEITTNVNSSSTLINKKIQNFASSSNRSSLLINDIINNIQYFAPIALKLPIFRIIRNVVAVAKGMRVFVEVLLNKEKDETIEVTDMAKVTFSSKWGSVKVQKRPVSSVTEAGKSAEELVREIKNSQKSPCR